ncbi:ThiF family adenylyltransferase [Nitratireductor aquibiodomus]|uniref:ThiF family adenylyltransferase n=1 Tax=Nitratireductor aquibiodomus TaxID=204799 RepID=UPI000A626FEF
MAETTTFPAALSDTELERYARHIVLPEIGGAGQQKLKKARVLVIGAGGLGAPVLCYLAAAGIGTLGVIDDDTVSLSNLQRQVIHDTDSVGMEKVESARASIARINPHVTVETHPIRLDAENAAGIIATYDMVVDGSDNFDTRYLLADTCEAVERPLVTAAVGRFDGSLTVLKPFERDADAISCRAIVTSFPSRRRRGLCPAARKPALSAL